MHKNAGESAVFFDLQSADSRGRQSEILLLHRHGAWIYHGTCPVVCLCTGSVRLLLLFSFVYLVFC